MGKMFSVVTLILPVCIAQQFIGFTSGHEGDK
jgi:hypothetical protein